MIATMNLFMRLETATILETSEIPIERHENPDVTLPAYESDPPSPGTNWHDHSGEKFVKEINNAYDEIIHWRKNI